MAIHRVRQRFYDNYVSIVLTVVSIIQALAFQDLAQRLPNIYAHVKATGDVGLLVHFLLCFVILLRVFQTVVTAALSYTVYRVGLLDVLLIYVIGAGEYVLFGALRIGEFSPKDFYQRFLILTVPGIFGYIGTALKLREEDAPSYREHQREIQLQVVNIAGLLVTSAISLFVVFAPSQPSGVYAAIGTTVGLVLIGNLSFSISRTLAPSRKIYSRETVRLDLGEGERVDLPPIEVVVRPASREHVNWMIELVAEEALLVLSALLDTSPRVVRPIVRDVLLAYGGGHEFGFRAFHIAYDPATGQPVGLILVSGSKPPSIRCRLAVSRVLVRHLGLVGLKRCLENARALGGVPPETDRNSLDIVFLAVDPQVRRRGVGTRLVNEMRILAREQGCEILTAHVRELETDALAFFCRIGFGRGEPLVSSSDEWLGKGRILKLTYVWSAPVQAVNPAETEMPAATPGLATLPVVPDGPAS